MPIFIEGIVVSFAIVPLIKPDPQQSMAYIVKPEAVPPKIKDIWYAAFCMGLVHYVLERVFRATMNPFITIMQAWLENNPWADFRWWGQFAGLVFACLYCYYFRPTPFTAAAVKRASDRVAAGAAASRATRMVGHLNTGMVVHILTMIS